MNNLVNLYSEYNYSVKENKQNRKRLVIAIVLTVIIHVVLILFFGGNFIEIPKPKDEIKVINVKLLESVQQPTALTPKKAVKTTKKEHSKPKSETKQKTDNQVKQTPAGREHSKPQEMPRQNEQVKPDTTKPAETVSKPSRTENVPTENQIANESDNPAAIASVPAETAVPYIPPKAKKQSAFDKFVQAEDTKIANNQQKWDSENVQPQPSDGSAEDQQAIEDLEAIKAIEDVRPSQNQGGGEGDNFTQTGVPDGDIQWKGSSRSLKSSGGIKAPEEISFLGIKVFIVLEFEVYPNGLIGKVTVAESTGETDWDNEIVEQFKSNYKFNTADGHATGKIHIRIEPNS